VCLWFVASGVRLPGMGRGKRVGGVNATASRSAAASAPASSALAPLGRPFVPIQWLPALPPVQALFDTGANPNCISRSVFKSICKLNIPIVQSPESISLDTAGRNSLPNDGVFFIPCVILGRQVTLPFVVCARLSCPVILGAHAAQTLGLSYNPRSNSVSFSDSLPLVHCSAKTTLAPGKASLVPVSLSRGSQPLPLADFIATIQGLPMIARTDEAARASLYLVNTSAEPIVIPRAAVLSVAEIGAPHASAPTAPYPSRRQQRRITPAVQAAIDDAVRHLSDARKLPLRRLLLEFQDVVSRDKFDLGHCSLVQHTIHTSSEEPMYRKQFPIPSAHISVIHDHVSAWLKNGIIEPAKSPYNSPIFCVPKKNGGFRLCLDFRALNNVSLPTNYSIRTVDDCLAEIGRCQVIHLLRVRFIVGVLSYAPSSIL
jgi:hypothetical protein